MRPRGAPGRRAFPRTETVIFISADDRARAPGYPPERVMPGALALLRNHDWNALTAKANASPNHVKSLDRWIARAREANPGITDEQARQLAVSMRRDHYVRMGKLSAQARRAARETQP